MKLLCLDLDGVMHPANDAIQLNRAAAGMISGPMLSAQMKSQGRFVWLPHLRAALEGSQDLQILIHSTWRSIYADRVMRDLLEDLSHLVVSTDGQFENRADMTHDEYIAAACELVNPEEVLVIDDRPEMFNGGLVGLLNARLRFLWCDPERGLSDPATSSQLHTWALHTTEGHARTAPPVTA